MSAHHPHLLLSFLIAADFTGVSNYSTLSDSPRKLLSTLASFTPDTSHTLLQLPSVLHTSPSPHQSRSQMETLYLINDPTSNFTVCLCLVLWLSVI